jgi:hypothetical protein
MSEYTADTDGLGTLRLLNAIRTCGLEETCKFYQVELTLHPMVAGCGGWTGWLFAPLAGMSFMFRSCLPRVSRSAAVAAV